MGEKKKGLHITDKILANVKQNDPILQQFRLFLKRPRLKVPKIKKDQSKEVPR